MSVKIKISYEHPEELQHVLQKLDPDVKSWKVARKQNGHFKKAYIVLEPRANHGRLTCFGRKM